MFNAPRLTISGCVTALLAACGFMLTVEAQQAPASAPASAAPHRTVVSQDRLSCHNERLKRGGLALDAAVAKDVEQHPEVWEKVVRKMRARQMPPIGLPRPDERRTTPRLHRSRRRWIARGSPRRTRAERRPCGG